MVNWNMGRVNPNDNVDDNLNDNDNVDANLNSSPSGEVGRGLLTLTITLTVLSLFGGRCDVIAFFEL